MSSALSVAVGAALGAVVRWAVSGALNSSGQPVQIGTLAVNVVGGLLIGAAAELFASMPHLAPEARLAVITGFLGGLTTFSTFSLEAAALLTSGRYAALAATVCAHTLGSITAAICGMEAARRVLLT